jgi:uncharacterized oxidoreductase
MKLTDNTILITGGASGIGRGLAEALHRLGNQVIIAGRRAELLREVAAANPGMDWIQLDIADPADISRVATEVVQRHPKLNVLFNNAGIMPFDDLAGPVDEAVLLPLIATNLLGPIRLTGALVGHLQKQPRATILNNSSVLAFTPLAGNAIYSATKAAIHSYTLSLRFQLRHSTVTVQEIAPPWVNTDLIKKSDDPRAMDLDAFVAETVAALATDAPEVLVEIARPLRANVGPAEHTFFTQLNEAIAANPIPV